MLNSLFIFWCMTYNNNGVELLLNKYHTEQLYRAPEERRLCPGLTRRERELPWSALGQRVESVGC